MRNLVSTQHAWCICSFWAWKYMFVYDYNRFQDLRQEALLGCIEAEQKYPEMDEEGLFKMFNLAAKWKVCKYWRDNKSKGEQILFDQPSVQEYDLAIDTMNLLNRADVRTKDMLLRYVEGDTMEDIAHHYGISKQRVKELFKKVAKV